MSRYFNRRWLGMLTLRNGGKRLISLPRTQPSLRRPPIYQSLAATSNLALFVLKSKISQVCRFSSPLGIALHDSGSPDSNKPVTFLFFLPLAMAHPGPNYEASGPTCSLTSNLILALWFYGLFPAVRKLSNVRELRFTTLGRTRGSPLNGIVPNFEISHA